ncbi:MAG: DUF2520 domain-containing protein [Paludibacteraceae bacterium]|nr:DUF2520 domain-containing protein [Paludibacteraceae bacterium]
MQIVVIGAGNLATSLVPAFARCGHQITQVVSRTLPSAEQLALFVSQNYSQRVEALANIAKVTADADLYVLAVVDDVIPLVAAELVKVIGSGKHIVCHTSGSVPLGTLLAYFEHSAVFYPFQTFKKTEPLLFDDIPLFVEATDDTTRTTMLALARQLSDEVYVSTSEQLKRLHIAGVFANNFTNCMYAIAREQLDRAGLPFSVLLPLIGKTATKVKTINPRDAQTGPASRGDTQTINQHLRLLGENERQIYEAVTQNIIKHTSSDEI